MSARENQCAVTTAVSVSEKRLLIDTAHNLGVPYYTLMRRLIRYLLDGKIEWVDVFRQSNTLSAMDESGDEKKSIRTQLSPEVYSAFARLADEWGSTTGVILRRLMLLYVTGKIGRQDIWY
jgi:hypothetical protein